MTPPRSTTPPPEIAALIRQRIAALDPGGPGNWPTRVCKKELNALPLAGNSVYLWALRPDGELLCLDHEAFAHPAETEADPLVRFAALLQGARVYPELAALIPPCPAGARPCPDCGGRGARGEAGGGEISCLGCRGLGWVGGGGAAPASR